MYGKALNKIYLNSKDFGFLENVEQLLRRVRQLYVDGVTQRTVKEYLRSNQANTLHKLTRRWFTRNHTYIAKSDA